MPSIAILTLVHKRRSALLNTLAGIGRSALLPNEVLIVYMNEKPYKLPVYPFPIREISIKFSSHLNLAEARNFAIANSSSEFNIFLDVDCIPDADLIAHYLAAYKTGDILWSGRVQYLSADIFGVADWQNRLLQLSSPDPVRSGVDQFPYELFWSLNFGCSRKVFERIGGFDTQYVGYGAEDTDFAFQSRAMSVKIGTVDALAFHQYHPSYSPPLNHLEKIIHNAQIFKKKWQLWPMEGWLASFQEEGYIQWNENEIRLIRRPTVEELLDALK